MNYQFIYFYTDEFIGRLFHNNEQDIVNKIR